MTLSLFDTHAHLNVDAFSDNVDAVVQRAKENGVTGVMVIGIDVATSRKACDLAALHSGFLFAAVGIQPNSVAESSPDDFSVIQELAGCPGVRAIGETGLDCYWMIRRSKCSMIFLIGICSCAVILLCRW